MTEKLDLLPYTLVFLKDLMYTSYAEILGEEIDLSKPAGEKTTFTRNQLMKEQLAHENTPYHMYCIRLEKKKIDWDIRLLLEYCLTLAWNVYMERIGDRFQRVVTAFRMEIQYFNDEQLPMLLFTPFIPNGEKEISTFIEKTKEEINKKLKEFDQPFLVIHIHIQSTELEIVKQLNEKMKKKMEENNEKEVSVSENLQID